MKSMDKFVDRYQEMEYLNKEYQSSASNLIVIYGRRRVGKTSLINEFLKAHENNIYFLATEESDKENLKAFAHKASEYTSNPLLERSALSWNEVFLELSKYHTDSKRIIVLDEFQYLCTSNRAYPSILQKIWDEILVNKNTMLILCGSLVHLMESTALNYSSPLYGRRTGVMRLNQIPFKYYHEFFKGKDNNSLVPFYALSGGTPRYIESICKYDDIYEAIYNEALNKNSYLYNEVEFLLKGEVSDPKVYYTILRAIANGNMKIGDIGRFSGLKENILSKYLSILTELDLVKREVPVTIDNPDKCKKGLYKIKDNYFSFYFLYLYEYRGELERGNRDYVLKKIKEHYSDNYVSHVYEDICREKVIELSEEDKIPFRVNKVGRYWGKECGETDIVGFDLEKENLLLGECKYSSNPKGYETLQKLIDKSETLKQVTGCQKVYFVIFSFSGFSEELTKAAKKRNDVLLISEL